MESLPLLPGYNFSDPMIKDYKIDQKLKFVNGFRVIKDNFNSDQCCNCKADDCTCDANLVVHNPTLTYGHSRRGNVHEIKRFLPHYVLFDRKTLRLDAYFKQGIFGSADECYRVHQVRIMYYLEDDTMAVLEKTLNNAGYPQGKLVRKSKIPKPNKPGEFYHWKDLNVAINIEIYGVVYRTVSCDNYTREFLTSQGIDVNDPEQMPPDPYLRERALKEQLVKSSIPSKSRSLANDKRYLFLEYNGMVLTFNAVWNDELYKVHYFLDDNTMSVSEKKIPGDKDRGGLLLKRTKVPKNWKDIPATYCPVYMEKTDDDVREYYAPIDLKIGETIFIFGRRFFLYDCDSFTRKYYSDMLKIHQSDRINVPQITSDDETTNTCRPRKTKERGNDLLQRLYNFPKKLRYNVAMEAVRPEDEGRQFVMEYHLCDGSMRIMEVFQRNSGRTGGCFLGLIRVPKPDEDRYYTPEDFSIGARLNVYGHWFVVTGTEPFVYKYMMANPQKFNEELRKNVGDHLRARGLIPEEKCPCEEGKIECDCEEKEDVGKEKVDIERDGEGNKVKDEKEYKV